MALYPSFNCESGHPVECFHRRSDAQDPSSNRGAREGVRRRGWLFDCGWGSRWFVSHEVNSQFFSPFPLIVSSASVNDNIMRNICAGWQIYLGWREVSHNVTSEGDRWRHSCSSGENRGRYEGQFIDPPFFLTVADDSFCYNRLNFRNETLLHWTIKIVFFSFYDAWLISYNCVLILIFIWSSFSMNAWCYQYHKIPVQVIPTFSNKFVFMDGWFFLTWTS